ncbi:MAG: hypothetical protein QNK27_00935 [Desulfuromusa sp.]|nr:hypothetical protein [Desulfuromusa sp.]
MSTLKIHDINSAPDKSKPFVEQSMKVNGRLPGLHGVMAEAPGLLEGYLLLHKNFQESSFNGEEITVVWLTINVEHNCTYCVPAHTGIAHMMKIDPNLTEALRNQEPMPTKKLQVLQDTTLAMLRKRGELSDEEIETFYAADYTQRNLLEIILALSQKVMSNYTNHIANTPTDRVFEKYSWTK